MRGPQGLETRPQTIKLSRALQANLSGLAPDYSLPTRMCPLKVEPETSSHSRRSPSESSRLLPEQEKFLHPETHTFLAMAGSRQVLSFALQPTGQVEDLLLWVTQYPLHPTVSLRPVFAAHCARYEPSCQLSRLLPPALCFHFSTSPFMLLPSGLPVSQ